MAAGLGLLDGFDLVQAGPKDITRDCEAPFAKG